MNPHIDPRGLGWHESREIRRRKKRENIIAVAAVVLVLGGIVAAWYLGLTR